MTLRMTTMIAAASAAMLAPAPAAAHCDSLDGPVVHAAQRALESGDLNHVLIWAAAEDEVEIRAAFEKSRAVRALGSAAALELADRYFFETVVRLHRATEGAPYTGLKPAGAINPIITAADRALSDGLLLPLEELLSGDIKLELRSRFETAVAAKRYHAADVAAGRRYVRAYAGYVELIERLHEAIAGHEKTP